MEKKIREYLSDSSARRSEDVQDWLINNLSSDDMDPFFLSAAESLGIEEEKEGLDETLGLISGLTRQNNKVRGLLWLASVSSAVACLLAVFTLTHREEPQKWESEYVSYGRTKCVTLPDQTRIWLHNDSKLVYPDHFGKERVVFAEGELYAEVSADPKHPFIVDAQGTKVKVLGTRFNMSSYQEGQMVVLSLLSGKVEMEVPTSKNQLTFMLEPGDRIEVNRETGTFSKDRIDVNSFKLWKDERTFYFMDMPLKDIAVELQEAFDVRIIVKDDRCLSTRYLAMFINGESLDTILSALNCDGKMTIENKDNTYYIYMNN